MLCHPIGHSQSKRRPPWLVRIIAAERFLGKEAARRRPNPERRPRQPGVHMRLVGRPHTIYSHPRHIEGLLTI